MGRTSYHTLQCRFSEKYFQEHIELFDLILPGSLRWPRGPDVLVAKDSRLCQCCGTSNYSANVLTRGTGLQLRALYRVLAKKFGKKCSAFLSKKINMNQNFLTGIFSRNWIPELIRALANILGSLDSNLTFRRESKRKQQINRYI